MGDANDKLHDANQPSRNDVLVAAEEDQNYIYKLETHLQTFLPFLMKVINNSELLEIIPDRVSKLRYWYKMLDDKRVSPVQLKFCKQLLYDLYNRYCKRLKYHLPADFKTSWMQETKLNEFELCNKIPVPSTSYEKIINNQIDCFEDFTVDIPSKVNKEELDSTSEQNSILINPTDQSKPKKHKKYSLSKEFENIIKDAAKSLNDDVCGPRTRSSVMKKEGIIKTIRINNSKPKFEKDNTTKNYEKLESGECSKNLDNGSVPNLADVRGWTEIGHNIIISSTLNDQSGVANSTTTEIVCKSKKKNIVSSNEINSKADNSPKIEEKALIDILKNPKFMAVMRLLKDEDKMEKLKKFLENDYIQIKNKPINIKVAQERKSKKPFVGPLSVKLARQKMEMEKKNSQSECNIKNPFEFETKKIGKGSKSIEQANQSPKEETRITTEPLAIEYFEYTLKEKSKKCVIAGLSCELMNSMLVFKCSVSNCLEIQFSTVIFTDFSEHVNKNHQFVVWDQHCEACHHKLPIISEQYYVRNALEHLVSHHLVLKNNEQHPNTADKPSSSSTINICEMSVNESRDDTKSNSKNVNLNINHGSNDKRFPSQITDVKSLKKAKVNTSKINSHASDKSDLNTWMKLKTNCEVIHQNPEIFLEEGQQIVNNGVPVDGTICLIDTAYIKDYIRKVQDFPMNKMKTRLAFKEMSALPRLLGLFKCMDRTCTKIFSSKNLFKLHMKLHFSNAEKNKKNQIYNVEQFKMCAYCFKEFDDEESLANHISEKYTFCDYFCPHCFYRAYTASHVLVHQSVIHSNILFKDRIIKLEYDDGACKYPEEMLFVVDFREFVLPYKCNVGCCGFSCYLHNEFEDHLNQEHQQCDQFCCYICAGKDDGEEFFALQPSLMITHFKLHNLNKYQCIFCLFGNEIIDLMIKHLALEHFEYEPLCLERSTVSDNCESKNIRNLKILKLTKVIDRMVKIVNLPAETISVPEVLPQQSNKRSIECPDILSVAMKSARSDEGSQVSDTIVITDPNGAQMAESSTTMPLAIDNECIMIDGVNQNQNMRQTWRINSIWSLCNNKEKESKVSSNKDVIVIDDDDDVYLSEKEELNEVPTKQICLYKTMPEKKKMKMTQ